MIKRLLLIFGVLAVAAACDSQPPAPDTPPAEAQTAPEMVSALSAWVSVMRSNPDYPGWEYSHPPGWETVTLDPHNIFLYSRRNMNERLFSAPLSAGEIAFQFSYIPALREVPHRTAFSHLKENLRFIPHDTLAEFTHENNIDANNARIEGAVTALQLSFVAVTHKLDTGDYIDIYAYSRSDELENNLPLLNAVIATVNYTVPME